MHLSSVAESILFDRGPLWICRKQWLSLCVLASETPLPLCIQPPSFPEPPNRTQQHSQTWTPQGTKVAHIQTIRQEALVHCMDM